MTAVMNAKSAGPVNFKVQDEPLRPRPTLVRIFQTETPHAKPQCGETLAFHAMIQWR